jgi:hypothetical protein
MPSDRCTDDEATARQPHPCMGPRPVAAALVALSAPLVAAAPAAADGNAAHGHGRAEAQVGGNSGPQASLQGAGTASPPQGDGGVNTQAGASAGSPPGGHTGTQAGATTHGQAGGHASASPHSQAGHLTVKPDGAPRCVKVTEASGDDRVQSFAELR